MKGKRVLSGIQPSGKLHLGNYFAMMRKMIAYQEENELYCFIADLHSLTSNHDPALVREYSEEAVLDFLALGIDPGKSVFWRQSEVPEVCELAWYLSPFITVPTLNKAHSFKDKVARGIAPSVGLYYYPILMAADILAFDSQVVPVGQDQKQHLEYTRDLAQGFNRQYGEVLVVPEADIDETVHKIPGTDGAKMSKSYGNTIDFFAPDKKLKKQVFSIKTDSRAVEEPKDPEDSVLYDISCLFLDEAGQKELAERYRRGGEGYGDLKKELLAKILDYFAPFREKRSELSQNPDKIRSILDDGARRARERANQVLDRVRRAVGVR